MKINLTGSALAALQSEYPTLMGSRESVETYVNQLVLLSVGRIGTARRMIDESRPVADLAPEPAHSR